MSSSFSYCGFWYSFDLEQRKAIALYHKFNYQDFPYHTYVVQAFMKRYWVRSELERCVSSYQAKYHLAPEAHWNYPLSVNAKREEPLPQVYGIRSVFHGQENSYEFDFCYNAQDFFANYVDLALGVYLPQAVPALYANYLHVPNYLRSDSVGLHTLYGLPTLAQVEEWVASFEQARKDFPWQLRPGLGICISRHDKIGQMPGVRSAICDLFSQTFAWLTDKAVFYPSKFRRNTNDLQELYHDDKIAYSKNFRFMICPENSYAPGYVTEKIIEAMAAGCIPIYWGGIETELDYFNAKAILFYDPRNPQALSKRLKELWQDQEQLDAFLAEPCFLPGTAARIFLRYIYPVAKRWSELQDNINLYAYLKQPQETTLEAEKLKAEQALAALGLEENKYAYLEQEQNRPPFNYRVNFEEYSQEEKECLLQVLNHYLQE
ncbi:glycosyltransferase [Psittacicella melopsittaci]|nr:glycosyltransferase family 10 [Psittacicella melopsittaci]